MADEIDIEEHDVMDNPTIKDIFPDLTVVKKEINYGIEDFTAKIALKPEPKPSPEKPTTAQPSLDSSTQVPLPIKVETAVSLSSLAQETCRVSSSPNVIILGSKPSKNIKSPDAIVHIPERRGGELVVQLHSVSDKLNKSDRYCKECKIYFFTKAVYAAHRRSEHSRVLKVDIESWVKQECYVCEKAFKTKKSLSAHYKNIHKCDFVVKDFKSPSVTITSPAGGESPRRAVPKPLSKKVPPPESNKTQTREQPKRVQANPSPLSRKPLPTESNTTPTREQPKRGQTNDLAARNPPDRARQTRSAPVTPKPKSLKRPVDVTEDEESQQPAKKQMNTRREASQPSDNLCDHCNTNFPTKESLIKHLYDILTISKSFACETCDETFATEGQLSEHREIHKTVDEGSQESDDDVNGDDAGMDNDDGDEASSHHHDDGKVEKYYRCRFCSSYYTNSTRVYNHTRRMHGDQQIPRVFKMTAFEPECLYCGKIYRIKNEYNKHIFNAHSRPLRKPKDDKITISAKPKNDHLKTKPKNLKTQTSEPSVSSVPNPLLPIPKGVLYKCHKCARYCVSQATLYGHTTHSCRVGAVAAQRCAACSRHIMRSSVDAHRRQHKLGDDFRIITLKPNSDESKRIMSNCPKCGVHFTDNRFWKHYPVCENGVSDAFHCLDCEVRVDSSSRSDHRALHRASDAPFTIIEYRIVDDTFGGVNAPKRVESNVDSDDEAPARMQATRLTYCRHCTTFIQFKRESMENHLNRMCVRYIIPAVCGACGLTVARGRLAQHRAMHALDPGLTLADFDFFEMTPTLEEVRVLPPPPKFPFCKRCRSYYKRRGRVSEHLECSKPDRITCELCVKHFDARAFALHKAFHDYAAARPGLKPAAVGPELQVDPENITFWMCNNCGLCVPSEKQIPRHLCNSSTSRQVCRPCGLELTVKFMRKHKMLHAKMPQIHKSMITLKRFGESGVPNVQAPQFRRVKKPKKASKHTKKERYEIVMRADDIMSERNESNDTEDDDTVLSEIRDKTKHKERKSATMIPNGGKNMVARSSGKIQDSIMFEDDLEAAEGTSTPSYVVYQCFKCSFNYANEATTTDHVCTKQTAYRCIACRLTFNSAEYSTHLLKHTKRADFVKQNISISFFGRPKERSEEVEKVTLLKCKCGLHFLTWVGVEAHVKTCHPKAKTARQKCTKCLLMFTPEVLFNHLVTHHGKNKTFECDVKMVSLLDFKTKLHRCSKCKIAFVDRRECEEHHTDCDGSWDMAEYCFVCRLPFHMSCAEAHTKQHIDDKLQDGDLVVVELGTSEKPYYVIEFDNKIYKCEDCDVYSTTEYCLNEHIKGFHSISPTLDCDVCDKTFIAKSLPMHKYLHHDMNLGDNLITECLPYYDDHGSVVYVSVTPPAYIDDILPNYTNTLYRCSRCSVNFITQTALQNHMTMNKHTINSKYAHCGECNLLFIEAAIAKHKFIHHDKMELTVDCFVVQLDTGVTVESELNEAPEPVVFKCVSCKVHFMSEDKLSAHITRPHVPPAHVASCNECRLNFVKWTLKKHTHLHHIKGKYALSDIRIVTPSSQSRVTRSVETVRNQNETVKVNDCEDDTVNETSITEVVAPAVEDNVTQADAAANVDGSDTLNGGDDKVDTKDYENKADIETSNGQINKNI